MAPRGQVKADIVVLTALGVEYDAVRVHLADTWRHVDSNGTSYEIGTTRDGACRIALSVIGEGNPGAAVLTSQAIDEFQPKALLFVGVAGGLKDAALGDVVVATRVHLYQTGKDSGDSSHLRLKSWPAPHRLVQIARQVAQEGSWVKPRGETVDQHPPVVRFRPIVSGEKVIDTRSSPDAKIIEEHYSDAAAIDMESAGTAEAAHLKDFHRAIMVRGVSDLADGEKRDADAAGWQQKAAANAAAFAVAIADEINRSVRTRWVPLPATPFQIGRLGVWLGLSFIAIATFSYAVFWLGSRLFYAEIGADTSAMPTPTVSPLPALGLALLIIALFTVMAAAFVVGAVLAPQDTAGRVVIPAAALSMLLPFAAGGAIAVKGGDSIARLVLVAVLMPASVGYVRNIGKRPWHCLAGSMAGFAVLLATALSAAPAANWLRHGWQPFEVWSLTVAMIVAGLGSWLWAENRRRKRIDDDISPAALLRRLFHTEVLVVLTAMRERLPRRRAGMMVIVMVLSIAGMCAGVGWGALDWLYGRVVAARAVLDLGYLPAEYDSIAVHTPVQPVTISIRRPDDQWRVCGSSPVQAASLLASDDDRSWVLLRTIGDPNAHRVVALREADYQVVQVPRGDIRSGEPWTRAAC